MMYLLNTSTWRASSKVCDAVQKLRHQPRLLVPAELDGLRFGHSIAGFPAHVRIVDALEDGARVSVDGARPVDVYFGVPVPLFSETVELPNPPIGFFVVPRVGAHEGRLEDLRDGLDVSGVEVGILLA
jgi:hypothetical protein